MNKLEELAFMVYVIIWLGFSLVVFILTIGFVNISTPLYVAFMNYLNKKY